MVNGKFLADAGKIGTVRTGHYLIAVPTHSGYSDPGKSRHRRYIILGTQLNRARSRR